MTRWTHTHSTGNSTRSPKRGNRALRRWLEAAGDIKPCPARSPRASRSRRQRTPSPRQEAVTTGRGWWAGGEAQRRRAEPPLRRGQPRPRGEGAGGPLGAGLLSARFPVRRDGARPGLAISLCKSLPVCLWLFLPQYHRPTYAAHPGGGRGEAASAATRPSPPQTGSGRAPLARVAAARSARDGGDSRCSISLAVSWAPRWGRRGRDRLLLIRLECLCVNTHIFIRVASAGVAGETPHLCGGRFPSLISKHAGTASRGAGVATSE